MTGNRFCRYLLSFLFCAVFFWLEALYHIRMCIKGQLFIESTPSMNQRKCGLHLNLVGNHLCRSKAQSNYEEPNSKQKPCSGSMIASLIELFKTTMHCAGTLSFTSEDMLSNASPTDFSVSDTIVALLPMRDLFRASTTSTGAPM